jgi:hypothetical protein
VAKGQPTTPPIPNHIIPEFVFEPPRQSTKDVMPNIVVYMEKLEGKYAIDA